MGFRLIRDGRHLSSTFREQLKALELRKESQRWSRLTMHTEQECAEFIRHFEEVLGRGPFTYDSQDELAGEITDQIQSSGVKLANIQGNLEINRLSDLVTYEGFEGI